ncbi:MAG TPA: selenocysteine-specific translation elongation factor [Acetobacteraceae bacterium]|nr:selenocysteine-specific translation elongation factor [Acetobacteraceae bacterium]
MRGALVAVLGHVDHGKTALVRALTGTDTDRLPEEKARGISIALGFAHLVTGEAVLDLVDVPGHERFVRTMAAGASAMQAALLVVDAREGVRAQTREHAEIASLLGITRGVVAVTRRDLAGEAEAAEAAGQAAALLRELGLGAWPILPCSAVTGDGIALLAAALGRLASPAPATGGDAWLPVDRAFVLPGAGLVVTGTLRHGALARDDAVAVLPHGREASVRGLHLHGMPVPRAAPGRRIAVALRGLGRGDITPGDALATPGSLVASARMDAWIRVLASSPRALRAGDTLRLHGGTAEAGARLRLLGAGALEPGASGPVQLMLDRPVALPAREGFILRLPSPARTVAGGMVLDAEAPRRRAQDATLLVAMAAASREEAARLRLRHAAQAGLPQAAFRRLAGCPGMPGVVSLAGERVLDEGIATALEERLEGCVAAAQRADPLGPGIGARAALAAALPPRAPGEAIAARLVARGVLALAGGHLRLRGAAALTAADRALLEEVEEAWRGAGLSPPETRAVIRGEARRAQAVRLLLARGVLVRAPDAVQKREYLFHATALAQARAMLREALAARAEGLTVSECGALLGLTRRHSVPLLERLDAERFTRRIGDRRHLHAAPAPSEA